MCFSYFVLSSLINWLKKLSPTQFCNIASIIVCDFIINRSNLSCFFLVSVHWQQTGEFTTVSVISCVLSSIFALSAVLGNGTIMLFIWKTRELHSPSFTLLFCLAVSDLLVELFVQPSFVTFKIAELKEPVSPKVLCVLVFLFWNSF